jgi:hypothetical protein
MLLRSSSPVIFTQESLVLIMGSGVSSSKASLSEVGIKNEIGVLYDASAK